MCLSNKAAMNSSAAAWNNVSSATLLKMWGLPDSGIDRQLIGGNRHTAIEGKPPPFSRLIPGNPSLFKPLCV